MHSAEVYSIEPSLVKPDVLESETRGSGISRSLGNLGEIAVAKPEDWSAALACYLENPGHVIDRKVQWQDLK
jgi:hypothetical protein